MFLDFNVGTAGGIGCVAAIADLLSLYERGLVCACPSDAMDLVEAHKWFNLAAITGDARGATARADIALDMTSREIVEAQRRARAFLRG